MKEIIQKIKSSRGIADYIDLDKDGVKIKDRYIPTHDYGHGEVENGL
jgi:hypothetical protein